jgi:hypothetical protein
VCTWVGVALFESLELGMHSGILKVFSSSTPLYAVCDLIILNATSFKDGGR